MAATDKAFTGSIGQVYERLVVPLIFAPYAGDLAARIAQVRPHRILETAAGTGVVTRALAARLPAGSPSPPAISISPCWRRRRPRAAR